MAQFTLKSIKKSMKPHQAHVHYIYIHVYGQLNQKLHQIFSGGGVTSYIMYMKEALCFS